MPSFFRSVPGAALLGLGSAAVLAAALALPPVHETASLRGYPDRAKLHPGAYDALTMWGMARAYPGRRPAAGGLRRSVAERQAQVARTGGRAPRRGARWGR